MAFIFLDTNLLVVLVVGRADPTYLASHKRTKGYDPVDVDVIERVISGYDGVVTAPHVLAEASSLLRQVRNPARNRIQDAFRDFIMASTELASVSSDGCRRDHFFALGLTDSIILAACEASDVDETRIELLTADEPIYNYAMALGLRAELYA